MASNEDMNDIIKIIKSLENSGVLIYGVNETVKKWNKKKKVDFLLFSYHIQPVISPLVKAISGRGIRSAGRR